MKTLLALLITTQIIAGETTLAEKEYNFAMEQAKKEYDNKVKIIKEK